MLRIRYFCGIVSLLLLIWDSKAQNYDSLALVSANWQINTLNKRVQIHQYHFEDSSLFGSKQYISYVAIKTSRKNRFKIAADPITLLTLSDFVKGHNALVAINGNFFDMKNGGSVDYTKVDGTVINENRKSKSGNRDFHQKAAVVLEKRKLLIRKWNGSENWEHSSLKVSNVMLNGPLLLFNNKKEKLDSNAFNNNRHPRTAVGITKNKTILFIVVDGRNKEATGMSLGELTKILQWLGCSDAINFDGGGSSTMWIKGKGVVNHPSDNKQWDHQGERKVANILYLENR